MGVSSLMTNLLWVFLRMVLIWVSYIALYLKLSSGMVWIEGYSGPYPGYNSPVLNRSEALKTRLEIKGRQHVWNPLRKEGTPLYFY